MTRPKILLLGSDGRVGTATLRTMAQALPECEVVPASRRPARVAGAVHVDVLDEARASKAAGGYDLIVDCSGPSSRLGEAVSRIADNAGAPLVSVGHRTFGGGGGLARVSRCGALPGILAAAFSLAPAQAGGPRIEVGFWFKGPMTPSAALDVLDEPGRPRPDRPLWLAGAGRGRPMTAFDDDDVDRLAKDLGAEVACFSVWNSEAVVASMAPRPGSSIEARASLLSAASAVGASPGDGVAVEVSDGFRSAIIDVPSAARLSASALAYAASKVLAGSADGARTLADLIVDNPSRALLDIVRRAGGEVRTAEDGMRGGADAPTFEEGEL